MRAPFALLLTAAIALLSSTASAMPYFPPPTPVYEAPIDRALQNVQSMTNYDEVQREVVMGRLNLLAYARDDANFAYIRRDHQLNEGGSVLCTQAQRGMAPPDQPPPKFEPDERCAVFTFDMSPVNEIPEGMVATHTAAGIARLTAAEGHYARAIALDSKNLRSRLGHAYVLDRLGRTEDARRELRQLIRIGMPKVAGPQSPWDDHAVLTEAAQHLSNLAVSRRDRRDIARLRARLDASRPMIAITPIVVPFTDAPFGAMIDTNSTVSFDFAGTGDKRAQGWLTPNAGWLVWDPNWRGDIRSGFDLIGARSWAVFWRDGFEALAALDDNHDGELTGDELGGLSLWRDENGDGVSQPGEVLPVEAHGITAIATRGRAVRPGLITAPVGVRFDTGVTRPLYDWTPALERRTPVS